jgi:valyl-tRNA synthetase
MPFITEEIWQVLTDGESMIIREDFPVYDEKLDFTKTANDFEKVIAAIKAVRMSRTELNVPNSVKAKLYFETLEVDLFSACSIFFENMVGASELEFGQDYKFKNALTAVTDCARIFIPMEELVDKEKELARLEGEVKRLEGELKRSNGMLSNERFLSKAPAEKIAEEKEKLAKYEKLMEQVKKQIEDIKK